MQSRMSTTGCFTGSVVPTGSISSVNTRPPVKQSMHSVKLDSGLWDLGNSLKSGGGLSISLSNSGLVEHGQSACPLNCMHSSG